MRCRELSPSICGGISESRCRVGGFRPSEQAPVRNGLSGAYLWQKPVFRMLTDSRDLIHLFSSAKRLLVKE